MINTRKDNDYWDPSRKGFVTNYPNFLHWKRLSAQEMLPQEPLNVYVHAPYCIQRCSYCYYKTINLRGTEKYKRMDTYVDALCREIELASEYYHLQHRPLSSVYFGGGTPSLFNDEQLQRINETLRTHLCLTEETEFTVEAEPVTLTHNKAETLKKMAINRVSMGVQSFDDQIIKDSNRLDSEKKAMKAIDIAKSLDASINIDLMSGLANETHESWMHSVDTAIATGVDSITVYKTELYTNTPYYKELRRDNLNLPSDDEELKFMHYALEQFNRHGYQPWSFYTFTTPGTRQHVYATRTFLGEDLYAFGVSAFGKLGDFVFQNTNDEQKYIDMVMDGKLSVARGHKLSYLEHMIRYVVLGMKLMTFDLRAFEEKYGFKLEALCAPVIEDLTAKKLIDVSDTEITLTQEGMLYGDYTGKSFAKHLMDTYEPA